MSAAFWPPEAVPGSLVPRLCGGLAVVLGLELIMGWLLHNAAMVKILPSSNSVAFNTAVAFVLAGSTLFLPHTVRGIPWRKTVSILLMVGASLILYENLFDVSLGLDWVSLHQGIQHANPRPGRVAPNTCMAFILIGIAMFASSKPDWAACRWLLPLCSSLQLVLIVTGIVGLMLDPTLLYGWYKFNRMAAPTAFGLGLLTMGVYYEHRAFADRKTYSVGRQEKNILRTGTLVLLAMGMAAAISTAVIFANHLQEEIRDKLEYDLRGQSQLVGVIITQAVAETTNLTARPLLSALIRKVAQRPDPAGIAQVQFSMERLLQQGFSSITLRWEGVGPPVTAGHIENPIEMRIALRPPVRGELMWRSQGFFFRAFSEFTSDSGKVLAHVTTEVQLDALTKVYVPDAVRGGSADATICGKLNDRITCFPSKFYASPRTLPALGNRPRLPVDDALDGLSGIRNAADSRGVMSLHAYAQLGNTGLVVLSKVDTADIYQPINNLIWRSLIVLAISLAIGVLLLRKTVGPLINAMSQSKARAVGSERRLKAITDNVPALIGFIDKDLRYRFVNATYALWFGRPAADIVGMTCRELHGEVPYALALPRMQRALNGEVLQFTHETPEPRGNYPQSVSVSYIPDFAEDGSVPGFNVLVFDVTEQHAHQRALSYLAHHDSLTELPNRRLFGDRLAQALVRGQRHKESVGLLYLDIDHFKQINDTRGHECGDLLLRAVAQRLTRAVRDSDTVARMGGDEFVVLMEGLRSTEDALAVAQKILATIRVPFELGDSPLQVTSSIGLAYSTGPDDSPEQLVQRSDAALYEAKSAGRDRVMVFGDTLPGKATV